MMNTIRTKFKLIGNEITYLYQILSYLLRPSNPISSKNKPGLNEKKNNDHFDLSQRPVKGTASLILD